MSIQTREFGKTKAGDSVTMYTLKNKNGVVAEFINYGAILVNLLVPDKTGKFSDVVLGYDNMDSYEEKNGPGFGSFIGRHANRIGGAKFTLNGKTFELEKNDGNNNLHGGSKGYNKLMYQVDYSEETKEDIVVFHRTSPDMEQGFPGNLEVSVTYRLTDENELIIEYHAVSDQDTLVNLTNHSYFNLAGHDSGDILSQKVKIQSNKITLTSDDLIPDGTYADVEGTPMDFRALKSIGQEIESDYQPLVIAGGYDHNYVLDKEDGKVDYAGELVEEESGRIMEIYTDLPGMQFYTGNFIDTEYGKSNAVYKRRNGVCFESQFFPNSCNVPEFKSCVLKAGEEFSSMTMYKFLTK